MFLANVFQPLIDVFESVLKFFHDTVGLGWGASIIALTIVVRSLLLPLTLKQFKSMQRLAHLQPEMKKLQDRYKGDKERLNQEMMKFYRENKVNPFASCLPMVAQLPVFLSLYYMLRTDLRHDICPDRNPVGTLHPVPCGGGGEASFLFIHDLTGRAYGLPLVILIVLYVGSQLLSTLLMSTTTDKTQRLIFIALPFLFVSFVFRFPAGLLVYWITTNFWTIAQQAIIRKRIGPMRPPTPEGEQEPSLMESLRNLGGAGGTATEPATARSATKRPADRPAAVRAGDRELASASGRPKARPTGPPPAPPRKKKKRSGRRR